MRRANGLPAPQEQTMSKSHVLFLALCALITPVSNATLITGDFLSADDGLMVLDTTSSNLWLKTSLTYNMGYDEVSALLATGGVYDGFRIAKKSEVSDVLTRYELGAGPDSGAPSSSPEAINRAVGFYNTMVSGAPLSEQEDWLIYTHALALDENPIPVNERLLSRRYAYYTMQLFRESTYDPMVFYPDWSTNDYGDAEQGGWFLVKSVPEPATLPLLAAGAFGLLYLRRKQPR